MPFTVTMPKLSPTMEEGVIAKWRKKEGDFVKASEVFLEITTDKATLEHTALDEGFLRKILVGEGKEAIVNQAIAIFTVEASESIEGYEPTGAKPSKKKIAEKPIDVPSDVKEERVYMTKETLFTPQPPLQNYQFDEGAHTLASPLAKRLAKEKNLDISTVKGTGPGGRITSRDLESALPESLVSFGKEERPEIVPGTYEEIPLTPMRKAIGKRLQAAKGTIPHFYVTQKIDAFPLVRLREELKKLNFGQITFNDMIIKGSSIALRKHPTINSGFDSANQCLIQFKTIDISVAVTIAGGLITPIIRHADFKNLGEISTEIKKLADRAHQGKLKEEEYLGGSFCISNLGMFGITEFIAVINPPQGAILAVGGIQNEAIVKEDKVVPGKTLSLTLSCDHRVIDGTEAALFLKTLKEILENPVALTI